MLKASILNRRRDTWSASKSTETEMFWDDGDFLCWDDAINVAWD